MSNKIDQRIVEMSFENQKFEKGINQSKNSLKEFSNALGQMNSGKDFNGLERSVSSISSSFGVFEQIAIGALRNVGAMAVNAGASLVKNLTMDQLTAGMSKYEQKTASVQTIMNATGKSIDEVNGYLDKLMWFSDETSYGFTDMTAALAQMTSSGGDIDKLIPLITGVANATAYAGKGAAEFSRAMYNLNQSYGRGNLEFIDWKSLELAGVAGKDLKQVFIDTGKELGVLNAQGKTVKGTLVTIGTFGSTLSEKWANTEVMEKAFGKFSELSEAAYELVKSGEFETAAEAMGHLAGQYSEIAEKGFQAAQQAKSFTEAIDATKDAVSTGWMKTYEIIFGTLNEAKRNFSILTEILYELFAAGAYVRNEMLQGIKDAGGIIDAFQAIKNLGTAMLKPLRAVTKAFDQIFPPKTVKQWTNIITSFKDFTATLIISDETANKIQRTFAGLFAVVDLVWQGIKTLGSGLLEIVKVFVPINGGILNVTASLGDFLVYLNKVIKSSGIFQYSLLAIKIVAVTLRNVLSGMIATISNFVGGLLSAENPLEYIGSIIQKIFSNIVENIKMAGSWISANFLNALTIVRNFLTSVLGPETSETLSNILTILKNVINTVSGKVVNGLKDLGVVIDNIDFNKVASFVTAGVLLLFVNQLTQLSKAATGVLTTTSTFITNFSKKMLGTTTKIKDLAIVIGTLAVSLKLLSTIEWEDLKRGLIGLAGAIGLFVLAYGAIQAVGVIATNVLKGQAMAKTAFELITLASGLAIMAGAIKTISNIKTDDIWEAAGVVGAMVGFLSAYQIVMGVASRISGSGKLSSNILEMSAGLLILIGVIKISNNVTMDEISTAVNKLGDLLIGIGVIQLLLGFAARIGGGNKLSSSILGVSTGILLLIGIVKIMNNVTMDEISTAVNKLGDLLIGIGVIQLLLGFAARIGGGNKVSTSILSIATGIAAMIGVIKLITFFTSEEIERALSTLKSISGIIIMLQLISGLAAAMSGTSKISSNLLGVAIGITAMVGLIKLISIYSDDELNRGLNTLYKMVAIISVLQLVAGASALLGQGNKAATSLISITILLAALGGVIAMLAVIPADSLQGISTALLNGSLAISVMIMALSAFSKTAQNSVGKMLGLSASLVIFAAALTLMAVPLMEISKLDTTGLVGSVFALGGLLAIFTGMAVVFEKLNVGATSLLALSGSLIMFGIALTAMSIPLLLLSKIDSDKIWTAVGAFTALLGVFTLLGFLDKSGGIAAGMISAAVGVGTFGLSLVIVTGALALAGLAFKQSAEAIAILIGSFDTLLNTIEAHKDTIIDDFAILGTAIATGIFNGIASFFGNIGTALNNIWINIISSIKGFFGINSPSTVMMDVGLNLTLGLFQGIVGGIGTVVDGVITMGKKVINAVTSIFDVHSPSRVFSTIGSWCTKGLAEGITKETKISEEAATNLGKNTEEAIRDSLGVYSLSDIWTKIGEWLPKSLSKGIYDAKDLVVTTANDLGVDTGNITVEGITEGITNGEGGITSALSSVLKILTGDSSITNIAEGIGASIGDKVSDGVGASVSSPTSGVGAKVKTELEKLKSTLENEKFYGRINLDQELAAYEKLRKSNRLSAEDRKQVDKEIYTLNKTIYEAQMSYIDGMADAEKDAASKKKAQKLQYESDITRIESEAEASRQQLREEYADKQLSINEKLISDIAAQNKIYEDALKSRTDAIYKSYGLFDPVERDSKVTGETLLKNLKDQEAAYADWNKSLEDIRARGVDEALVSEIEAMGPANKAQIKALLTLTDEQLDEYVSLYQSKYSFARGKAELELENLKSSTSEAIQQLNDQAAIDLSNLELEFTTSMSNINVKMRKELSELEDTYKNSLKEIRRDLSVQLEDLKNQFNSTMRNVNGLTEKQYADLIMQNNVKLNALNQNAAGAMTTLESTYAKSGQKISTTFNDNMSSIIPKSNANLTTLNTNTDTKLTDVKNTYGSASDEIVTKVDTGGQQIIADSKENLDTLKTETVEGLTELNKSIETELDKTVETFFDSGYNSASGFAKGIREGIYLVEIAARAMANAAKRAAEEALDEHSPSRVFMKIGQFVTQGFADGIIDYADRVVYASEQMVNGPIAAVTKAMAELESTMDDDMRFEPVITPVLDLSNLKDLSSLFPSKPHLFAKESALKVQEIIQNGTDPRKTPPPPPENPHRTEPTIKFEQNNYSPKPLSRLDIYRQTRNQLSEFKTLVGVQE